ncbi:MAG: diguanylate cyclase, partial [Kutzneria sp.]|nr:diguanylate cyclase [Kutzneria sp.]
GLTIARLASLASSQRRLAITDSLTGLYTRRFFEIQLPIEVARARRTGGSLGVFVIDVDHFKSVNDRYGHPAGDQALCEIAARLGSATRRDVDLLARHGGEEFALLVPDAGVGELAGIAERLRDRVADGPIEVSEGTLITVTVSVGATCFPAHGDSPNELVSNADRALYAAKARGRDRVIVGQVMTVDADEAFPDGTATVDYLGLVADRVDMLLGATGRSRAVGRWSAILATAMGLSEATVRTAELAGRLHSIGKIVIPESVLTKPMPWSEDERRLVRTHPELGYRLARAVPGFAAVADAIRQQHEHYDGGGHPSRLAGAGIRVEARILSVCEYWADLLLDRPHQPALSALAAAERLRAERATRFDPVVVDLFLDLQRAGRVGERCPLAERTVPRRTPRGPRTAREPA